MNSKSYITKGFQLLSTLDLGGMVPMPQAAVAIDKGDALFDDTNGYITNVGTAFAATFFGIAGHDSDNSAGAAGDKTLLCVPALTHYKWRVKNTSATVAAQTDVGEIIDLEANDAVDVTDTTVTAWGFRVDEIDISTDAIAANAGGFVKGSFVRA